ncbi:MAG: TetR/AcrR family transcriptional regulator [Intrasporangium sp.]|uniref:TetR/AcrR family transcriptional regulator n=1 Tax=Intrasporangium sp. TaxID=1925024 RepID=UPI00264763AB|nr:TetR/AcrR family transcriptional regulator [Intrasporangium sp.]MDN5794952.1 TetR/AcrR family transcriptional regulator [Intrasporangium sp.]
MGLATPTAGNRPEPAPRDGRDTRWEAHREQRRGELVDATIRAIRAHGAGVGMDDIASTAATSKTVIYRHFGDKAGLYRAVADRIDQRVYRHVSAALAATGATDDLRVAVASTVEAYLSLVESDAEVYRFVVNRPLVETPLPDDPVEATTDRVVDLLLSSVPLQGDPRRARLWAIAFVGSVRAVADDWLSSVDRLPRGDVVGVLTDLAWRGLGPMLSVRRDVHPSRASEQ